MDVKQQGALAPVVQTAGVRREGAFARLLREYRLRTRADVFMDILIGLLACLFAQTHALFGVYPFATALLCGLRRHVGAAYIGAAVGCWFMGERGTLYLIAYTVLLILRVIFSYVARRWFESQGLFDEHPLFRVLEASLLGCMMAAYELAFFGVYDYTVLFALGAVFLPAALTLLYAGVAESGLTLTALLGKEEYKASEYVRSYAFSVFVEVSGLALLFSVVFALSGISFFGVALGKCAITLFTLVLTRRFGALRGTAAALILSLAEGVTYAPAFGLLGLLAGLYQLIGMPCALAAAVAAGGGFAVYVNGLSGFLDVVPEMAVTTLLAWPLLRTLPRTEDFFFKAGGEKEQTAEKPAPADGVVRAYASIAAALENSKHRLRVPDAEEYAALCRTAKESVCRRCPVKGECTEEGAVAHALSAVCRGDAPAGTLCEGYPMMETALRREAASLLQKKRAGGGLGTLSAEYALHARLLAECEAHARGEEEENRALGEKLTEQLLAAGIAADAVSVVGRERFRITLHGVRWQDAKAPNEAKLYEICTDLCGKGLSSPSLFYNGKRISYTLESVERYAAVGAIASASSGKDEPSGDRAVSFKVGDRFYSILCDGMGSGRGAAEAAELSVTVLTSLLREGVRCDTALALLSNLLCAAEEERSVSLDLLSLDLVKGEATFLKSGAAASFAFRDGVLYRIRAKTVPMGLFRETEGERVRLDVAAGDLFVLLSDGVLQGSEDGAWLKELLREHEGEEPEALARRILESAILRAGGEKRDDMTVALCRLREA